nr:IS1634 family transposase [Candidatus Sigynarchaeota archaeon]
NRAVALNSKRQVQNWFNKTALSRVFPKLSTSLSTQNICDHMEHVDQENIQAIEEYIGKELVINFQVTSACFLFDPTNFFTYIRDYKKNTIAQRGYNKKKRTELRQICTSLLVTRDNYTLPIMHETYEGNVPDATHFKLVLPRIEQRLKSIGIELPKITLVFDKGNNSADIYKFLDSKRIHFVSSVRPSMNISKKLLDLPLSHYEVLWTKENGRKVFGYRSTTSAYIGEDKMNSLIVTFDEDTYALQEHHLDERIAKATTQLSVFIRDKLNTKAQWKDPKMVAAKIHRDILKTKELRSIVVVSFSPKTASSASELDCAWKIDDVAKQEHSKKLGKSLVFSNRNEWSTAEIVKAYRAQAEVERQFKELNKRDRISVMPIYHRTDANIRVHVFVSVLALLLSNLLYRKIRLASVDCSKEECFEALKDIKEIHLYYNDEGPPDVVLTQMSALQRKVFKSLTLKRFTKK